MVQLWTAILLILWRHLQADLRNV